MNKKFITHIIQTIKKFTVIDWLLCIACLALFVFLLLNRVSRQEQWVSIKMKVSGDEWWWQSAYPEVWYGMGLSKNQFAYDSLGKKIAEIQSVENYDVGGPRRLIFVNLKILTTYNKKTHAYSFNYQTLQIGKPLDFTFNQMNLHGLVTFIGGGGIPYGKTKVEVKLLGITPWEAASYATGILAKDMDGNTVSAIEHVDIEDTRVSEIKDTNGRIYILPTFDPVLKDVTLQLTLKTYSVHNVPYFVDGTAIKVGNRIWVEFERTAIKNATISTVY